MDMMSDIAALSMTMKMQDVQMDVSTALTKRVMADQEQAAAELLQMMPQVPQIPKGEYIDVYA